MPFQLIQPVTAWLKSLITDNVPGVRIQESKDSLYRDWWLLVDGVDHGNISFTVGVASGRHYISYRGPSLAEQVVVKAYVPGSDNLARTFKARTDGTFNGPGIINAIRQFVQELKDAQTAREQRLKRDEERADGKKAILAALEAAGIKPWLPSSDLHDVQIGDIKCKITAGAYDCSLHIEHLSVTKVLELIQKLNSTATV